MSHPKPLPRLVERCQWQPWAWVNDYGAPELEMPTHRFAVVAESRAIIRRMLGLDPPLYR